MVNVTRPAPIPGLSSISAGYGFLICDVWGVLHNGVAHFHTAGAALETFRAGGGRVLLVSNAPRPNAVIHRQLDRFGVPRGAYDGILTSGDVAREYLAAHPGLKVLPIGPERDRPIYDGLPITLAAEADADFVACTGLVDDDRETPDDYMELLGRLAIRRLPMLCINPDIVVERGDRLIWCAGALAERYAGLGGEVVMVGKPHAPVYASALAHLSSLAGRSVAPAEVLAVGDGIGTDIRGAVGQGIDVLFVTGGIHTAEFGRREEPDPDKVAAFLAVHELRARAFIPFLVW
jgi:HAD superfamily hydrolase (TIGR01459 family)